MDFLKRHAESIVIFLLAVAFGYTMQWADFNELPVGIHAWAQACRVALAKGFVDNGFDFFHPQTQLLNHQFPSFWMDQGSTSITAVDFPIVEYLIGLLMKLSDSQSPFWYRIVHLGISSVFILGVYRLARKFGLSILAAVGLVLILVSSPIYLYYQSGFLSFAPALASLIWGLFFYFKFTKSNEAKQLIISVAMMSLAALLRSTFLIPLLSIFGALFLRRIFDSSLEYWKVIAPLTGVLAFGGISLWNAHLTSKYGSLFLNHLLPADNWSEYWSLLDESFRNWGGHYLSVLQIAIVTLLILLAAILFLRRIKTLTALIQSPAMLLIIWGVGLIAFSIAMTRQFPHHDYYFLDTFFPWLITCVLLSTKVIIELPKVRLIATFLFPILGVASVYAAIPTLEKRHQISPSDITYLTQLHFKDAGETLDNLGVPPDAKILLIHPTAPNLTMLLLDRKGYIEQQLIPENLEVKLDWNYDYAVCSLEHFTNEVVPQVPEVLVKLEVVKIHNGLLIMKKNTKSIGHNLGEFLSTDSTDLQTTFNMVGDTANHITASEDYKFQYKIPKSEIAAKSQILKMTAEIKLPTSSKLVYAMELENVDKTMYSNAQEISGTGNWETIIFMFPASINNLETPEGLTIKTFFWNADKIEAEVRNCRLSSY